MRATLLALVLVILCVGSASSVPQSDCSALVDGMYDTDNFSWDETHVRSIVDAYCSSTDTGLSATVPIEGVPKAFGYTEKTDFCQHRSNLDYSRVVTSSQLHKVHDETLVAYKECTGTPGLHAALIRDPNDEQLFSVRTNYVPVGNAKPPILIRTDGQNYTCLALLPNTSLDLVQTFQCTRRKDTPTSLMIVADMPLVGDPPPFFLTSPAAGPDARDRLNTTPHNDLSKRYFDFGTLSLGRSRTIPFQANSLGPSPLIAEVIWEPENPGDTQQFELIDAGPVQITFGHPHNFAVRFTAKNEGVAAVQIRIRAHVAGQKDDQFYDNPTLKAAVVK